MPEVNVNKLLELQHLLKSCDIDILLITETLLSDAFSSSLLIFWASFQYQGNIAKQLVLLFDWELILW